MNKNHFKRAIKLLEKIETEKYRGCDICTHLGEKVQAKKISWDYDGLIFSPCMACDKIHDCFQLDSNKLAEEVELGLVSSRQARKIRLEDERRQK